MSEHTERCTVCGTTIVCGSPAGDMSAEGIRNLLQMGGWEVRTYKNAKRELVIGQVFCKVCQSTDYGKMVEEVDGIIRRSGNELIAGSSVEVAAGIINSLIKNYGLGSRDVKGTP